MRHRLAKYWNRFTSPLSSEPDTARQEHMSKVILVILSLVGVSFTILTLLGWWAGIIPLDSFIILLGLSLLFILGWWLAHRGRWQIGGTIPIVFILFTAGYGNFVGGIDAPAMLLYALCIVLTVILKDRPVQWFILVLCLVSYLGFGLAHAFDFLTATRTAETVLVNRIAITLVVLVSITLSLQFLDTQFRKALADSRERAREAHIYSERIRGMFESALDGIIFADLEGNLTDANDAAVRLVEAGSLEAVVGRNIFDFIDPIDRSDALNNRETTLERGYGRLASYRLITRTGEFRYAEVNSTLLRDERGRPSAFVAIIRDVTDRKQAEDDLKQSEARYRRLVENAPLGIIAVDLEGHITETNPNLIRILGSPSQKATHAINIFDFPPLIEAGVSADFRRCLDSAEPVMGDQPYISKWGKKTHLRYHLNPIRDGENRVRGVQGIVEDITQHKQIEEIMLQSAKLASIGGLAAGMAHEINNPLGAIVQSAQMMERILDINRPKTREQMESVALDPEAMQRYLEKRNVKKFLEGIRSSGARAAKIVTDLLTFSRRDTDEMLWCDLNDLINTTVDLAGTDYNLKKHYDFRQIKIDRELADRLPSVFCEQQQIQQVVLNLLRNAAQAMVDTGQTPRLVIRTFQKEEWIRLEIEDNGSGIPQEIHDRLFEPFYTTKDIGKGTGLGLWLCWSIVVERHRGRIWVESGRDGGSCFIIELPIQPPAG